MYLNGKKVLPIHPPDAPSSSEISLAVQGLTHQTDSTRWRSAIKNLLSSYIQPAIYTQAVGFLISNITRAKDTRSCCKCQVMMDLDKRPRILNLEQWREIMRGMNFEITEPDTNNDITLVGLTLTDAVSNHILDTMERLLRCLRALTWEDSRMILFLDVEEGLQLLRLEWLQGMVGAECVGNENILRVVPQIDWRLQSSEMSVGGAGGSIQLVDCMLRRLAIPATDVKKLGELCERYPKTMEKIGFLLDKRNKAIQITGPTQPFEYFRQIHTVLYGLYFSRDACALNSVNV